MVATAHACPACGRGIDPLRAGEVAFIDGRFVYFCGREHKAQWLSSRSTTASDDVETASPPSVAPVPAAASVPAPSEEEPRSMPIRAWTPADIPASVREPTEEAAPGRQLPSLASTVAYAGIVTGLMAVGVALVGGEAGAARLPLAALAVACALGHSWMVRASLDRIPKLAALAVGAALGCAAWARASGGALADTAASFAGIEAAAFIALVLAIARAREPINAARQRILSALDVLAETRSGPSSAVEIKAGEQVTVGPGETVPVDGVVASGEAVVIPWYEAATETTKKEGAAVVAGARVIAGSLRITATWTGADRAYVRLFASPDKLRDAPLVGLATILDGRALLAYALVAGGVTFAIGMHALEAAMCTLAVVAAFGTPATSFAVRLVHARAHLRALESGIVHRDARHFDRAAQARIAVVCARGTVLLGEPEIVAIEPVTTTGDAVGDAESVLALASAVATGSTHPFAAAVLRAARVRGVRPAHVRNAVHFGSGATAIDAHGERVVMGRRTFLLAEKVSVAMADERVREHEAQGRSVLLVARAARVVGLVALQDGLRAGARAAIQRLHEAHIEPVLLSGEARETCEAIGQALDIDHLRPEVDGPDRGAEVRALAEGGDVVAVLGHPAIDDAALGAADVGVALDAAGGSPGEWAIALASDDVRAAAQALTLARAARERSIRAMIIALTPGIVVSFALAFQLVSNLVAPIVGVVAGAVALLYAKE